MLKIQRAVTYTILPFSTVFVLSWWITHFVYIQLLCLDRRFVLSTALPQNISKNADSEQGLLPDFTLSIKNDRT